MKINKTYRSLLDKSINSMLSAIEIYNKPNFSYREETFAILAVNAWELLLKAYLLRKSSYKMEQLYVMETINKKNGEKSSRKKPRVNRTGNPMTINIFDAILRLEKKKISLSKNLKDNIESLIELRDNAIHFHNEKHISKEIQEIGFACIKNYMIVIKSWNVEIDLSNYNFYLMPLAYVDSKVDVDSVLTDEVKKYLNFVKNKIDNGKSEEEDNFTIAISIDISFKKSNTFDGLGVQYDSNGVVVTMSEEDVKRKFPHTYEDITNKAKKRYSDFKKNYQFNDAMKIIKKNPSLCHNRKLDPSQTNSMSKQYYSSNIWQTLDKIYNRI